MKADPKMQGKPEAMLENIAKGKLAKFFKESTLEDQDYQMGDGKSSVKEYLQSVDKDAKIVCFRRYSLNDEQYSKKIKKRGQLEKATLFYFKNIT